MRLVTAPFKKPVPHLSTNRTLTNISKLRMRTIGGFDIQKKGRNIGGQGMAEDVSFSYGVSVTQGKICMDADFRGI